MIFLTVVAPLVWACHAVWGTSEDVPLCTCSCPGLSYVNWVGGNKALRKVLKFDGKEG